jgi:hypothetical protein
MEKPEIDHVEPFIVCLDSLPEAINLQGESLRPVVHNLLGDPEIVLPGLSLVRIRTERGDPVDPQEVYVLPTDLGGEVPPFRWISDEIVQFDLLPSHGLRPGVYSITIENPDGTIYTLSEAMLLHRRPTIESVEAEVTGEPPSRRFLVTLEGGPFFLTVTSWPPLFFFEDSPVSFVPLREHGCRTLTVQSLQVETCSVVEYELPLTLLMEEDIGERPFFVAPFGETDCLARHAEGIGLAPCPLITSVEPRIPCTCEEERTVTVTGTSLTFDTDVDPMVQVGAVFLEPTLHGCTESGGIRTCSSLTFELPVTVIEEVDSLELRITDLVMEGHCEDPVARLSLAPPPAILEPEHHVEHDASPATIWVNGEYLMWEGALPLITFGDEEPEPVDDIYYCDYLTDMVGEASRCLTILATVPAHLVVPGAEIPFTVTQAPPIGCTSTVTGSVLVSEEP